MMPLESYERTNIKVYLAHMLWKKKITGWEEQSN